MAFDAILSTSLLQFHLFFFFLPFTFPVCPFSAFSLLLLSGLLLCSRAFGINRSSCPLTRNGQGCGLPTQFTALYLPPTCNCRAAVLERSPRLLPPTCKPSTSLQLCLKFSPKVRKPTQLGAPAALNSDTRRIRDAG